MDSNDHLSIKNLLFTKAIPNYVIPVPTAGHIVYACTDCGDKFIFASSYDYHINRKSVKISYFCRHCNNLKVFFNRCNLLSHIRSHAFKTATINVSDLKLDPLPLNFHNDRQVSLVKKSLATGLNSSSSSTNNDKPKEDNQKKKRQICMECNSTLHFTENGTETAQASRAKHYNQQSMETYTCPLCLFSFATSCALKCHLRFHFKLPPYFCPECGKLLANKNTNYPINHECESFMMMRTTTRLKCPVPDCHLVHPTEFIEHIKENHVRKVYKCPYCYVACFDDAIMKKHLNNHAVENKKSVTFYQCEICPGKFVLYSQLDNHLKIHMSKYQFNFMYPCWVCGQIFKDLLTLTKHHMDTHFMRDFVKVCFQELLDFQNSQKTPQKNQKTKKIYKVVKKCDQCHRSFSYRCKLEHINNLPNECPYKCTAASFGPELSALQENLLLTCHMCKNMISQDWEEIKKHFNKFHKTHRCVDVKVVIPRINIDKYLPPKRTEPLKKRIRKRNPKKKCSQKNEIEQTNNNTVHQENVLVPNIGEFVCRICLLECNSKQLLQEHLLSHRDPCMAYQCMECGQSFVVKPSFSKHMLLEHSISDIDKYIFENSCYNESALMKYQDNPLVNEPLRENQCKICREQFENSEDLEKHFRVHGMAFLMKNNSSKSISP